MGVGGEAAGSRVTSVGSQLQDPGEGLFGTGVDEVRTSRGVKGLPVATAEGGEFVHCHEALIALPPEREREERSSPWSPPLALVLPGSRGKLRPRGETAPHPRSQSNHSASDVNIFQHDFIRRC